MFKSMSSYKDEYEIVKQITVQCRLTPKILLDSTPSNLAIFIWYDWYYSIHPLIGAHDLNLRHTRPESTDDWSRWQQICDTSPGGKPCKCEWGRPVNATTANRSVSDVVVRCTRRLTKEEKQIFIKIKVIFCFRFTWHFCL